jgi:Acetoacetate decarboxylase (ADC)
MSYSPQASYYHRMPVVFGPSCGPRQAPLGITLDAKTTHRRTTVTVKGLSDASSLAAILPPDFELRGDPIVTCELSYMTEIAWLGGRGYNMLGMQIPVAFHSAEGVVAGDFLSVLWENLADPILSGRDELGHNKIFADIEPARVIDGRQHHTMGWMGHRFFEMELHNIQEASEPLQVDRESKGLLNWKYVPKTGLDCRGEAELSSITLTPAGNPHRRILRSWHADGSFRFLHSNWEDLPTQFQIVNAFAEMPIHEFRSASIVESIGNRDLGDTRTLGWKESTPNQE